jgi:hypothetical protein
VFGSDV